MSDDDRKQLQQVANPFGVAAQSDHHAVGASAMAAGGREVAEVQAALIGARMNPRSQQAAMDRIISACSRPGLAEVAVYQYSRGGNDISGPSIRLAEEMARQWGNVSTGIVELSRGRGYSECLAYCWDLENNYRDEKRFQVRHWRDTRQGGYQLTDERDIYELIANMGSRRKRACILSVIPGDVQEAAVRQAELTLKSEIDINEELLTSILKGFSRFGVTKEQIEERIQRRYELSAISPGHVLTLRKIFASLKDGMSVPEDWFNTPEKKAEEGKKSASGKMDQFATEKKPEAAQEEAKEPEEKAPDPDADEPPAEEEKPAQKAKEPAKKADPEPEAEPDTEDEPPPLFGDDS